MTNKLLYKCVDLSFHYKVGKQDIAALSNVNLEVKSGDFICLNGPSGSGKSTLLNLLGLIEPVQKGELTFIDKSLQNLSESEKNQIRKHKIGFIFQSFHLMPILTAYENVEFFLIRQGISPDERAKKVEESLRAVKLWEQRMQRPSELSGGQKQRVAIARALAKSPDVIIADEPTASIDQKTGHEIMDILVSLNKERNVSVILASHDRMVIDLAPIKVSLKDGQIASMG